MGKKNSGQSMVEFAMVVASFVLVTFAAVSAAFHSIQRAMAETAAAAGVQVAASGTPSTGATPGTPATPDLAGAYAPTRKLLQSVLFGSSIVEMPAGQNCSQDAMRSGSLEVCAYQDGPNLVGETIRGRPAFPVPWIDQVLPWSIDVTVEMHQVVYQP